MTNAENVLITIALMTIASVNLILLIVMILTFTRLNRFMKKLSFLMDNVMESYFGWRNLIKTISKSFSRKE